MRDENGREFDVRCLIHDRYKLAAIENIVGAASQLTIYFSNDGR